MDADRITVHALAGKSPVEVEDDLEFSGRGGVRGLASLSLDSSAVGGNNLRDGNMLVAEASGEVQTSAALAVIASRLVASLPLEMAGQDLMNVGKLSLALAPPATVPGSVVIQTNSGELARTAASVDASRNVTFSGDVTVNGSLVEQFRVEDTIIDLAVNNPADTQTSGLVIETNAAANFSGLLRDGNVPHAFSLFDGATSRPVPGTPPPTANATLKLGTLEASAQVTASNVLATNSQDIAARVEKSAFGGKGALLVGQSAGTPTELSAGTKDQLLTANPGAPLGVEWTTPVPAIPKATLTQKGDMVAALGAGQEATVTVGNSGDVLTAAPSAPSGVAWAPIPTTTAADVTFTPDLEVTSATDMQTLGAEVSSATQNVAEASTGFTALTGGLSLEGGTPTPLEGSNLPVEARSVFTGNSTQGFYFTTKVHIKISTLKLNRYVFFQVSSGAAISLWESGASGSGNRIAGPFAMSTSNPLVNDFYVHTLASPVTLRPGTYLVSFYKSAQYVRRNTSDTTTFANPLFNVSLCLNNFPGGDVYPGFNPQAANIDGGAGFDFQVVPEPFLKMPAATTVPANSSSAGDAGTMVWGDVGGTSYLYICVADSTWRRVALAAF